MEHISSIWDVSAMVFWKRNVRHHHGDTCLHVILKDEQVHFELIFLDHVYFFSTDHCYLSVGSNILTGKQNGSGCVRQLNHEVRPFASCRRIL